MANVIVSGVAVINSLAETDRIRAEEYNSKALTGKSKVEGRNDGAKTVSAETVSFQECFRDAVQRETSVFPAGEDVVMANPPVYATNYNVDRNKSRDAMTLDEYKQYICNKVSSLPISHSRRACSSGVLIFKEEAFESMKNNPDYEDEVMNMLQEDFSAQLSGYEPDVRYQVIGKTRAECYGAAIPIKNYGWMMGLQNDFVSSALSSKELSGYGLLSSGLLSGSLSGFGLAPSDLLTGGLSGLGLTSSGLWTNGISSLSLMALGASSRNTGSLQGLFGTKSNRANMVNVYRSSARNGNSGTYMNSSNRKWRV